MKDKEDTINEIDAYLNALDKLDFRKVLLELVRNCLLSKGYVTFPKNVNQLKTAVCVQFPNLDFTSEIKEKDQILIDEYYAKCNELKEHNEIWFDIAKREIYTSEWEQQYWESLLSVILDVLGKKKGLLLGLSDSKPVAYGE